MFSRSRETEQIALLKERIGTQRQLLRDITVAALPGARKAALLGGGALAVKKASPILRPIAFGLIQRSLLKRGKRGWLKGLGIVGLVIGAFRFLSSSDDS